MDKKWIVALLVLIACLLALGLVQWNRQHEANQRWRQYEMNMNTLRSLESPQRDYQADSRQRSRDLDRMMERMMESSNADNRAAGIADAIRGLRD